MGLASAEGDCTHSACAPRGLHETKGVRQVSTCERISLAPRGLLRLKVLDKLSPGDHGACFG